MADPLFEFDPTSEDAANSPLSVWNTASYMVTDFSVAAPPFEVQWASSVDTEGALPASVKPGNRTINLTVECLSAAALRSLQLKAGKLAREQGTAKITFPANSETLVVDILSLETFNPSFDFKYFVHAGAYCTVSMSFTIHPYGRGPVEDLGDNVETSASWLTFTETSLKGDVPGLGRLVVDNDQASDQRSFIWGLRSRYYSSASTAAVFYQAESCALASATATTRTGATGSGNTVAAHTSLAAAPAWDDLIYLGASSTAQTHIGSYRVLARVQAPSANTGVTSARITWKPSINSQYISNPEVTLSDPASDAWEVVDLGMVTLPKAPRGTQGWLGLLQANSTVAGEDIYVDWIALLPVSEASGQLLHDEIVASTGGVEIAWDGAFVTAGGYLGKPDVYEGDYLLVPASGDEARTLQVMAKFLRYPFGDAVTTGGGALGGDEVDDISARLYYTPRFLVVPTP